MSDNQQSVLSSAQSVTYDPINNFIYFTGSFRGTLQFPGLDPLITLTNNLQTFIVKMDPTNGNFIWARQTDALTTTGLNRSLGSGIDVDASGNIYVTGILQGTVQFGNLLLPISATGNQDAYVTKLDSNGNFLWVNASQGIPTITIVTSNGIAVSPLGNIFITGAFQNGQVLFGAIPLTSIPPSAYIAEIDTNGLWVNATQTIPNPGSFSNGRSLTFDTMGNLFLYGVFNGTVQFGNLLPPLMSAVRNIFVAKLTPLLTWEFVAVSVSNGTNIIPGNIIFQNNNLYMAGVFRGSYTFGSTTLTATNDINGGLDYFLAILSEDGSWIDAIQSTALNNQTIVNAGYLANDIFGNIYTTGYFSGSFQIQDLTLTSNATIPGGADIFIINIASIIICFSGKSKVYAKNTKTGEIANVLAKDIISGVHEVYSTSKQEFVPIRRKIISGPTKRYMLIEKDALGTNQPNEDFYVTRAHVIMYKGVPTKAKNIPEAKLAKVKSEMVYSICTDKGGPILVNGLEVMTYKYSKWIEYTKKRSTMRNRSETAIENSLMP